MNKKIVVLFLILFFSSPYFLKPVEASVNIAFYIDLLSPNTDSERNQWIMLIQEQFSKIGIGVRLHESTTWDNIAPRTYSYPLVDYDHIPTYAEGGYDLLFIKRSWDLEWDPTDLYSSRYLYPSGNNIYQYNNPKFDAKLDKYLKEFDPVLRNRYSHDLQKILYEDLPSICIVYPRYLFAYSTHNSYIDYFLLSISNHRAENWEDHNDSVIKYAIPEKLTEPNIFVQKTFYDAQWMQCVYGSLYQRARYNHEWEPVIATDAVYSSDYKNLTVTIDPNAKFSDGSPVLAEDVKYSYELYMTPAVHSLNYDHLTRWFTNNDSIEIVNPYTLNFNLTRVYTFAYSLLSYSIVDMSIVEPAIADHGYNIFNEIPLTGNVLDTLVKSCGPFMLDVYDSVNGSVKLLPNPFWNNLTASGGIQPLLDELYFIPFFDTDFVHSELIAGHIDIMDYHFEPLPCAFFGWGSYDCSLVNELAHEEIAINLKHPVIGTGELTPVGTPEAARLIRKAISHAIPRNEISYGEISYGFNGFYEPGIIPMPDYCIGFDYSLKPYRYELDSAIYYLEQAGYCVEGLCSVAQTTAENCLLILCTLGLSSFYLIYKKKPSFDK